MKPIIIDTRNALSTCTFQFDHDYEDKYTKHNVKIISLGNRDILSYIVGFNELVITIIGFFDLDKANSHILEFNIKKENQYSSFENFWTLQGEYQLDFKRIESINGVYVSEWIQKNDPNYDMIRKNDETYQFYELLISDRQYKSIGEYLVVFKYVDNPNLNISNDYSIEYYCAPIDKDDNISYDITYDGIKTINFNRPGNRNLFVSYLTETPTKLKDMVLEFLRQHIDDYNNRTLKSINFIYNGFEIHSHNIKSDGNIVISSNNQQCILLIALDSFIEIMMNILIHIELSISYQQKEI